MLDDKQATSRADTVRRVVLCTGKIAIDLLAQRERERAEDVAIVRVEMLYPFPEEELRVVLDRYPNVREVVWVQEEPRNMGAWTYISPLLAEVIGERTELKVIARPEWSSPATGFSDLYQAQQEQIIEEALHSSVPEVGGKHGR